MTERKLPADQSPELVQRKLEDFLARLGKRFGEMKGKVEFSMRPPVSFSQIGGPGRPPDR
ncbi:MAG: hypothetical protein WC713_00800 [Candidatus Methylomirabilota bacterium]